MSVGKPKRVIITGATGFVGKALCPGFIKEDYTVVVLSRNLEKGKKTFGESATVVQWDGKSSSGWLDYADGAYAIVNLAGENIASGRWTEEKKKAIIQSRLDAGRAVVDAVNMVKKKPKVVIQASAIGYYGSRQDEIIDETSGPGKGFPSQVAQDWERSTQEVESHNVRQIIIRTAVVLGKEGGALPRLMKPFRLFVGGPLGRGRQWLSWIHIEDEVRAILFLLKRENSRGVFNLATPFPLRQRDFARILGKSMKRPSWFSIPSVVLNLFMGEMAKDTLLPSQRIQPKRLLEADFQFKFPDVKSALKQILGSRY